jgi:glycosyltransferase involved in cell wall biosynthesis
MKVLVVSSSHAVSGAGIAAYRHYKALQSIGIDTKMLVQFKVSNDINIIGPTKNIDKLKAKIRTVRDLRLTNKYKNKDNSLFSTSKQSSKKLVNTINKFNPDIVNLHWISYAMLKIEDIPKINAPIVWTLQDMWPYTGGCHYDKCCDRYKIGCGKCKILHSSKNSDISKKNYNRKFKSYQLLPSLTLACTSNWIKNGASESMLVKNRNKYILPNTLDTRVFKPINKEVCQKAYNLPTDNKLILFGAIDATGDERKGYKLLIEAINKLATKNVELVIFGNEKPLSESIFNFKVHYVGKIRDTVSLALLYSAVHVMIVPSLQEAFGQTASEALACGTPTICFSNTGTADIIDHKTNGYIAELNNTTDLSEGINWILNNPDYLNLCENARKKAIETYDYSVVANSYKKLYTTLINEELNK